MGPVDEPVVRQKVSDLIKGLERKIDAYHAEVKAEIRRQDAEIAIQDKRINKLEFQQKSLRVWGLVALFAGGAGGTVIAGVLGVG